MSISPGDLVRFSPSFFRNSFAGPLEDCTGIVIDFDDELDEGEGEYFSVLWASGEWASEFSDYLVKI